MASADNSGSSTRKRELGGRPGGASLPNIEWVPNTTALRFVADRLGVSVHEAGAILDPEKKSGRVRQNAEHGETIPLPKQHWAIAGGPVGIASAVHREDLLAWLDAIAPTGLRYIDVVARYLSYERAQGLAPSETHAWPWMRTLLAQGLLTVHGPGDARERLTSVSDTSDESAVDDDLRDALQAVRFDEAEIDALLSTANLSADGKQPGHQERKPRGARGPKPKDFWPKVLGYAAGWLSEKGEAPDRQRELEDVILNRIEQLGGEAERSTVRSYAREMLAGYRAQLDAE
jgi:hypothetical protein